MFQYDSKSNKQPDKTKATTVAANKDSVQAETKMPVQAKSLFSFSHSLKNSEEQKKEQKQPKSVPVQPNNTGIPTQMKNRFENLSGLSFADVKVHYNSDKPTQLQALAYAQGNEVHIAPGQEKYLGHELGHVVQQKLGIVKPTMQLQGVNVNDDPALERGADLIVRGAPAQMRKANVATRTAIIQRRAIPPGDIKKNIEDFVKETPTKRDYSLSDGSKDFGHFHATYKPQDKKLNIELPVNFDKDFPVAQKEYFIKNVKETWSGKYQMNTSATTGIDETPNLWKERLNPVAVEVDAKEDSAAEFNATYNKNNEDAISAKENGKRMVKLSEQGYYDTRRSKNDLDKEKVPKDLKNSETSSDNYNPDRYVNPRRSPNGYNVYGHESGHMFGLADEYPANSKGFKTRHYDLTEKAFGKEYAEKHATQQPSDSETHKDNIMNSGTKLKPHHYVTFWDAMIMAIKSKFADKNKAPTEQEDWKIE